MFRGARLWRNFGIEIAIKLEEILYIHRTNARIVIEYCLNLCDIEIMYDFFRFEILDNYFHQIDISPAWMTWFNDWWTYILISDMSNIINVYNCSKSSLDLLYILQNETNWSERWQTNMANMADAMVTHNGKPAMDLAVLMLNWILEYHTSVWFPAIIERVEDGRR